MNTRKIKYRHLLLLLHSLATSVAQTNLIHAGAKMKEEPSVEVPITYLYDTQFGL